MRSLPNFLGVFSIFLGLTSQAVFAQDVAPSVPQTPPVESTTSSESQNTTPVVAVGTGNSTETCFNNVREIMNILREKHDKLNQCIQSPVHFQMGKDCQGAEVSLAWPQCNPLQLEICELEKQFEIEMANCRTQPQAQPHVEAQPQGQAQAPTQPQSTPLAEPTAASNPTAPNPAVSTDTLPPVSLPSGSAQQSTETVQSPAPQVAAPEAQPPATPSATPQTPPYADKTPVDPKEAFLKSMEQAKEYLSQLGDLQKVLQNTDEFIDSVPGLRESLDRLSQIDAQKSLEQAKQIYEKGRSDFEKNNPLKQYEPQIEQAKKTTSEKAVEFQKYSRQKMEEYSILIREYMKQAEEKLDKTTSEVLKKIPQDVQQKVKSVFTDEQKVKCLNMCEDNMKLIQTICQRGTPDPNLCFSLQGFDKRVCEDRCQ